MKENPESSNCWLNKKLVKEIWLIMVIKYLVSQLNYSFINEKGYLLDVKGSINTSTLIQTYLQI